jgi:predicted nucleic acid-binding protein
MSYLLDTSALVRILRNQVRDKWNDEVVAGSMAVCEPVICETLTTADSRKYDAVEIKLRSTYSVVPVPANAWELIGAIRSALAARSAHQGLSVADYLIAATAIKSKLVLLHEDGDFETVARFVPQLQQQRISEGS